MRGVYENTGGTSRRRRGQDKAGEGAASGEGQGRGKENGLKDVASHA
jgi:hypothetical protein